MTLKNTTTGFPALLRIALLNLLIVALLGCVLRYKIAYSFPIVNQKFILESHSHFAFTGWVTHALMVLLAMLLYRYAPERAAKLRWVIIFNLITAYSMLIAFALSGYNMVSIICSTLSLVAFFIYAILYWQAMRGTPMPVLIQNWIRMALVCGLISSLGTFYLAYMFGNHHVTEKRYLGSLYFFLHFQYNGWFLFSCFALFFDLLKQHGIRLPNAARVFQLFAWSVVPAYLLSVLWLKLPGWLYAIATISALLQVAGLVLFINDLLRERPRLLRALSGLLSWAFSFSVMALTIKICLQLGSLIPALRKLAFGYRSIVIGYLHLALLGIITIFLAGYLLHLSGRDHSRKAGVAMWIFLTGIILNEIALMVQGFTGMSYINIPYINQVLFFIALLILTGVVMLNLSQKFSEQELLRILHTEVKE